MTVVGFVDDVRFLRRLCFAGVCGAKENGPTLVYYMVWTSESSQEFLYPNSERSLEANIAPLGCLLDQPERSP